LPDIDDFHEVHAMLQQRVEQWNETIREQGRQEGRRKTALAMIQHTGLDDATIADVTELSIDEVQQLRNTPTHH
jgi:predicted transposase YdaD